MNADAKTSTKSLEKMYQKNNILWLYGVDPGQARLVQQLKTNKENKIITCQEETYNHLK